MGLVSEDTMRTVSALASTALLLGGVALTALPAQAAPKDKAARSKSQTSPQAAQPRAGSKARTGGNGPSWRSTCTAVNWPLQPCASDAAHRRLVESGAGDPSPRVQRPRLPGPRCRPGAALFYTERRLHCSLADNEASTSGFAQSGVSRICASEVG